MICHSRTLSALGMLEYTCGALSLGYRQAYCPHQRILLLLLQYTLYKAPCQGGCSRTTRKSIFIKIREQRGVATLLAAGCVRSHFHERKNQKLISVNRTITLYIFSYFSAPIFQGVRLGLEICLFRRLPPFGFCLQKISY